jgi:hypothetical protein
MTDDDYAKRRLAELHAAAPAKPKKIDYFAMVPLATAAKACAAVNCPKVMVYLWLVHQARKTGKNTVAVPNGALGKYGVSREIKRRALKELEACGVISIRQQPKKTPLATLL